MRFTSQVKKEEITQTFAKDIGRNRGTIEKLLEKAHSTRSLDNQHKQKGRFPKGGSKLEDGHKKYILQWLEEGKHNSTNQIYLHLNSIMNLKRVGYDSVNNYVKSLGRWVKPRVKTVISEKNLMKRLEYCQDQMDVIVNQDVLFTDESLFELNRNTTKVFKFTKDAMPEKEKLSTWVRQMVWAGISWKGKTKIVFIEGWINNRRYVELLKSARKDILGLFREDFYFLQDNARPHVHQHSLRYIRRWISPQIKDHPPQSPDLNPIEIVWGKLKNMVELRRPRDKKELREAILECWDEIPMTFIRNCIAGLPSKMAKAIDDANSKLQVDLIDESEFDEGNSFDSFGDEYDSEEIDEEDELDDDISDNRGDISDIGDDSENIFTD